MHDNCKLLLEKYARGYFRPGMHVLELGPEALPSGYRRLVADDSITWHTLSRVDDPTPVAWWPVTYLSAEDYRFPIPDEAFDLVLSGSVINYVRKPWLWLREVA